MIKLKNAIKVNNYAMPLQTDAGFSDRIIGNYKAFEVKLDPAFLMFLAVNSPEIVFMNEGVTVGNNSMSIDNKFYMELSIVSSLADIFARLNDYSKVTYKEMIVVEQVLNKLGIKDTNEFIKQIKLLFKDEERFSELKKLYLKTGDSLSKLIEIVNEKNLSEKENNAESTGEAMYMKILKRIGYNDASVTLYDIKNKVRQFRNSADKSYMLTAEHKHFAEKLEVLKHRNIMYKDTDVNNLFIQNPYEYPESVNGETVVEELKVRLTKAVLYNAMSSLINTQNYEFYHTGNKFLSETDIKNFFIGSGKELFNNFKENYLESKVDEVQVEKINTVFRENFDKELEVLEEFEEIREERAGLLKEVISEIKNKDKLEVSERQISELDEMQKTKLIEIINELTKKNNILSSEGNSAKWTMKVADMLTDIRNTELISSLKEFILKEDINDLSERSLIEKIDTLIEDRRSSETQIFTEEKTASETKTLTEEKTFSETKALTEEKTSGEIKTLTEEKISGEIKTLTEKKISGETKALAEEKTSNEIKALAEEKTASEVKTLTEEKFNTEINSLIERRDTALTESLKAAEFADTAALEIVHKKPGENEESDDTEVLKTIENKNLEANITKNIENNIRNSVESENREIRSFKDYIEDIEKKNKEMIRNIQEISKKTETAENRSFTIDKKRMLEELLENEEKNETLTAEEKLELEKHRKDVYDQKLAEKLGIKNGNAEKIIALADEDTQKLYKSIMSFENGNIENNQLILRREDFVNELERNIDVKDIAESNVSKETLEKELTLDLIHKEPGVLEAGENAEEKAVSELGETEVDNEQINKQAVDTLMLKDAEVKENIKSETAAIGEIKENLLREKAEIKDLRRKEEAKVIDLEAAMNSLYELLGIKREVRAERRLEEKSEAFSKRFENFIEERRDMNISENAELIHKNIFRENDVEEKFLDENTELIRRSISGENDIKETFLDVNAEVQHLYSSYDTQISEEKKEEVKKIIAHRLIKNMQFDDVENYINSGQKETTLDYSKFIQTVVAARVKDDEVIYEMNGSDVTSIVSTMVHKKIQTIDEEEILETVREENLRLKKIADNESRNSTKNTVYTKEEIRIDQGKESTKITANTRTEIQNIVNERMRMQIEPLADKIYKKLEYRLRDERRRRGF
ncbi:hypothetical protein SAMN05216390_10558 [Lachnospiraceae bacterium KH1T2]|nr:hypothetical protein SAMN05216390_10558 [Lachnospiraceae bacterium KH1T2]